MPRFVTLRQKLIHLPRWPKRLVLMANDFLLMSLALWLGLSLRLSTFYVTDNPVLLVQFIAAPILGLISFHYFGLYRLVTRYIGQQGMVRIVMAVSAAVLGWALLIVMLQPKDVVPRSVMIIYWIFTIYFVWLSRQVAGWILKADPMATPASWGGKRPHNKQNVLIYGAGETGVQLLGELNQGKSYHAAGFIDPDQSLWGQKIHGVKVYDPKKIGQLIQRGDVKQIFIAQPNLSRREQRQILRRLEPYPVKVKMLPAMADIASGKVTVSDLRPIYVAYLLGRDQVPPNEDLLSRNITGRSVMITGAGGSIGSELAKQVLLQRPRQLILFELSEVALYKIDVKIRELEANLAAQAKEAGMSFEPVEIVSLLGSVLDKKLVRDILVKYEVETIYHAAAYKHVPLVEKNPVAGLQNNTFGTGVIAGVARDVGVERFVLISTDKAVRPTNVMGASKRLAELVLQGLAAEPGTKTVFTMVRFGNVLDSSGSVVRRFRQQIAEGGPVTVTHKEIIRYFMSIPEAAQLVIQAGAMGNGGDVFVLDMGEPVKIDDLARAMIHLTGLEVRDANNPDGDIEITYIGLREGEKLYEELLIGDNTSGTEHPRILRNEEAFLPMDVLRQELKQLSAAMEAGDETAIRKILLRTVEGYNPDGAQMASTMPRPPASSLWPDRDHTVH